MNPDSSPGAALKQLLEQHGQQLAFDADATLPLLMQACPGSQLEVESIVAAQRLRIPWELMNMGAGADPARLDELANTLSTGAGMPDDAARWIIQTWMNALDIKVQGAGPAADPVAPEASAPAAVAPSTPAIEPTPAPAAAPPRYFVVGQGGAKYGPADVATLNQWAAEGRIQAGTSFEEEGTGRIVQAHEVAGLFLSQGAQHFPPGSYAGQGMYGQNPQVPGQGAGMRPEQPGQFSQAPQPGSNYMRGGYVQNPQLESLANTTLIKSIVSMICVGCMPLGIIALVYSIMGRTAMNRGELDAESKLRTSNTIANISIGIGVVIIVLYVILMIVGVASGGMRSSYRTY